MPKIARKQYIIAIVSSLLLILVISAATYALRRGDDLLMNGGTNTTASDGTEFPGPTEQELKDTEAHKETLAGGQDNTNQVPSANPVITSATSSEVRAYVAGVAEDGGTCTAVFSKGDTSFEKQSVGVMNVSNTVCGVINVTRTDFNSSGTWSVVLNYESTKAKGSSAPVKIEIQ